MGIIMPRSCRAMRVENRDRLLTLANQDLDRGDTRRAKDRLRAVLGAYPTFGPALDLLGHIYYFEHSDYRNASIYWSRAGRWDSAMLDATTHVLRAGGRALLRQDSDAVRRCLYTFAGASPPGDVREQIHALRSAYYRLRSKRSKLAKLACAPISGLCLMALVGLIAAVFGAGWGWFAGMASVATAATVLVLIAAGWSYFNASRLFRKSAVHLMRWMSARDCIRQS
jgi:hypothetical protein